MELSVTAVCELLINSRLMLAEEVHALEDRWLREAGDAAEDLQQFKNWLVANGHVTEYQAGQLLKGQEDQYFLNQYKILGRINQGRMAGVYQAVHPLGAVVAIKVLPPGKARDKFLLARFQREARMAMRLKHPNVVRTFQASEARGLHFLVMEYLEGETLKEVLQRRGKLPDAEAARLLYQALTGLQHIDEQGIVHRDLKPSNLMLVPRLAPDQPDTTERATVKILDIGLGRAQGGEAKPEFEENMELTGEDTLLGTPDYLAPEQAADARSADIRSDIYSLGCVFYETLSGHPPFPDTNFNRQLIRHATQPPRPLKEFCYDIPDTLQQIVSTMLAKDPAQRYQKPGEAAQALGEFVDVKQETPPSLSLDPRMRDYINWLALGDNPAAASSSKENGSASQGIFSALRRFIAGRPKD